MEFGARPEISEEVAFSRRVSSPQLGPHPGLEQLLRRHSQSRFLRPIADFSRVALEPLFVSASAEQQQVVLDLGCGVGESTLVLARKHPAAKVIGIDKSAIRLARFAQFDAPQNAQVVRADSVDALLLAQELELQLAAVYLWYPNPWPKKKHLQRRWHAHAVFPTLLAFKCPLELRTNWKLYAEEFAYALRYFGRTAGTVSCFKPTESQTPFERKYLRSGHELYRLEVPAADCSGEVGAG